MINAAHQVHGRWLKGLKIFFLHLAACIHLCNIVGDFTIPLIRFCVWIGTRILMWLFHVDGKSYWAYIFVIFARRGLWYIKGVL